MTKYRILDHGARPGVYQYEIQQRFLLLFWRNIGYRSTLPGAIEFIGRQCKNKTQPSVIKEM